MRNPSDILLMDDELFKLKKATFNEVFNDYPDVTETEEFLNIARTVALLKMGPKSKKEEP